MSKDNVAVKRSKVIAKQSTLTIKRSEVDIKSPFILDINANITSTDFVSKFMNEVQWSCVPVTFGGFKYLPGFTPPNTLRESVLYKEGHDSLMKTLDSITRSIHHYRIGNDEIGVFAKLAKNTLEALLAGKPTEEYTVKCRASYVTFHPSENEPVIVDVTRDPHADEPDVDRHRNVNEVALHSWILVPDPDYICYDEVPFKPNTLGTCIFSLLRIKASNQDECYLTISKGESQDV